MYQTNLHDADCCLSWKQALVGDTFEIEHVNASCVSVTCTV